MYKFICANISKTRNFTSSYKKLAQNKKYHLDGSSSKTAPKPECVEEKVEENQEQNEEESGVRTERLRPSSSPLPAGRFPLSSKIRNIKGATSSPTLKLKNPSKFYTGNFLTVEPPTPSISKKYFHVYSISPASSTSNRLSSSVNVFKGSHSEKFQNENYKRAMQEVLKIKKGKSDFQWQTKINHKPAFVSSEIWAKRNKRSKTEITYPTHTVKHNLTLSQRFRIKEGPPKMEQKELEDEYQIRKKEQQKFFKKISARKIMHSALNGAPAYTKRAQEGTSEPLINVVKKVKISTSSARLGKAQSIDKYINDRHFQKVIKKLKTNAPSTCSSLLQEAETHTCNGSLMNIIKKATSPRLKKKQDSDSLVKAVKKATSSRPEKNHRTGKSEVVLNVTRRANSDTAPSMPPYTAPRTGRCEHRNAAKQANLNTGLPSMRPNTAQRIETSGLNVVKRANLKRALVAMGPNTTQRTERDRTIDPLINIVRAISRSQQNALEENERSKSSIPIKTIEKDFESLVKSHPTLENASKEIKMKLKRKFVQLLLKSNRYKSAKTQNDIPKETAQLDENAQEVREESSNSPENVDECKEKVLEEKQVEKVEKGFTPPKLNYKNIEKETAKLFSFLKRQGQKRDNVDAQNQKSEKMIKTLKSDKELLNCENLENKLERLKKERMTILQELEQVAKIRVEEEAKLRNIPRKIILNRNSSDLNPYETMNMEACKMKKQADERKLSNIKQMSSDEAALCEGDASELKQKVDEESVKSNFTKEREAITAGTLQRLKIPLIIKSKVENTNKAAVGLKAAEMLRRNASGSSVSASKTEEMRSSEKNDSNVNRKTVNAERKQQSGRTSACSNSRKEALERFTDKTSDRPQTAVTMKELAHKNKNKLNLELEKTAKIIASAEKGLIAAMQEDVCEDNVKQECQAVSTGKQQQIIRSGTASSANNVTSDPDRDISASNAVEIEEEKLQRAPLKDQEDEEADALCSEKNQKCIGPAQVRSNRNESSDHTEDKSTVKKVLPAELQAEDELKRFEEKALKSEKPLDDAYGENIVDPSSAKIDQREVSNQDTEELAAESVKIKEVFTPKKTGNLEPTFSEEDELKHAPMEEKTSDLSKKIIKKSQPDKKIANDMVKTEQKTKTVKTIPSITDEEQILYENDKPVAIVRAGAIVRKIESPPIKRVMKQSKMVDKLTPEAKSTLHDALDDMGETEKLNEIARKTEEKAIRRKQRRKDRKLHEQMKQKQSSLPSLRSNTSTPKLDKVEDLLKEKVQIGNKIKEKIEKITPQKQAKIQINKVKVRPKMLTSIKEETRKTAYTYDKASKYDELNEMAQNLSLKKKKKKPLKKDKKNIKKGPPKGKPPMVLKACPLVQKIKSKQIVFKTKEDVTNRKKIYDEKEKYAYAQEDPNKLPEQKLALAEDGPDRNLEGSRICKIKSDKEKAQTIKESSKTIKEQRKSKKEEEKPDEEKNRFALYPKSPKQGKRKDCKAVDYHIVKSSHGKTVSPKAQKSSTELSLESKNDTSKFPHSLNKHNWAEEQPASEVVVKQAKNLKHAVDTVQSLKVLFPIQEPPPDKLKREKTFKDSSALKDFKSKILRKFFDEKQLPGCGETIYFPKKSLVVSNITEINDENDSDDKNLDYMTVQDETVLRRGDEIFILQGIPDKFNKLELKDDETPLVPVNTTILTQKVTENLQPTEKTGAIDLKIKSTDEKWNAKADVSLTSDEAYHEVQKIDKLIHKVKDLENMLLVERQAKIGDTRLENKPRVPPIPIQPPGVDKKDIKKDRPKGPKDMILPPKIRGKDPIPEEVPKGVLEEEKPQPVTTTKSKESLNLTKDDYYSKETTFGDNLATIEAEKIPRETPKIIVKAKKPNTFPQKSNNFEKAIKNVIEEEKLHYISCERGGENNEISKNISRDQEIKRKNQTVAQKSIAENIDTSDVQILKDVMTQAKEKSEVNKKFVEENENIVKQDQNEPEIVSKVTSPMIKGQVQYKVQKLVQGQNQDSSLQLSKAEITKGQDPNKAEHIITEETEMNKMTAEGRDQNKNEKLLEECEVRNVQVQVTKMDDPNKVEELEVKRVQMVKEDDPNKTAEICQKNPKENPASSVKMFQNKIIKVQDSNNAKKTSKEEHEATTIHLKTLDLRHKTAGKHFSKDNLTTAKHIRNEDVLLKNKKSITHTVPKDISQKELTRKENAHGESAFRENRKIVSLVKKQKNISLPNGKFSVEINFNGNELGDKANIPQTQTDQSLMGIKNITCHCNKILIKAPSLQNLTVTEMPSDDNTVQKMQSVDKGSHRKGPESTMKTESNKFNKASPHRSTSCPPRPASTQKLDKIEEGLKLNDSRATSCPPKQFRESVQEPKQENSSFLVVSEQPKCYVSANLKSGKKLIMANTNKSSTPLQKPPATKGGPVSVKVSSQKPDSCPLGAINKVPEHVEPTENKMGSRAAKYPPKPSKIGGPIFIKPSQKPSTCPAGAVRTQTLNKGPENVELTEKKMGSRAASCPPKPSKVGRQEPKSKNIRASSQQVTRSSQQTKRSASSKAQPTQKLKETKGFNQSVHVVHCPSTSSQPVKKLADANKTSVPMMKSASARGPTRNSSITGSPKKRGFGSRSGGGPKRKKNPIISISKQDISDKKDEKKPQTLKVTGYSSETQIAYGTQIRTFGLKNILRAGISTTPKLQKLEDNFNQNKIIKDTKIQSSKDDREIKAIFRIGSNGEAFVIKKADETFGEGFSQKKKGSDTVIAPKTKDDYWDHIDVNRKEIDSSKTPKISELRNASSNTKITKDSPFFEKPTEKKLVAKIKQIIVKQPSENKDDTNKKEYTYLKSNPPILKHVMPDDKSRKENNFEMKHGLRKSKSEIRLKDSEELEKFAQIFLPKRPVERSRSVDDIQKDTNKKEAQNILRTKEEAIVNEILKMKLTTVFKQESQNDKPKSNSVDLIKKSKSSASDLQKTDLSEDKNIPKVKEASEKSIKTHKQKESGNYISKITEFGKNYDIIFKREEYGSSSSNKPYDFNKLDNFDTKKNSNYSPPRSDCQITKSSSILGKNTEIQGKTVENKDVGKSRENKELVKCKNQPIYENAVDNVNITKSSSYDTLKTITRASAKETKFQEQNKEIKSKSSIGKMLIPVPQPKKQVEFTKDDNLYIKVNSKDESLKTDNPQIESSPKDTKNRDRIEQSKYQARTDVGSVDSKLKPSPLEHVEFYKVDNVYVKKKSTTNLLDGKKHETKPPFSDVLGNELKTTQPDSRQRENLVDFTKIDNIYIKKKSNDNPLGTESGTNKPSPILEKSTEVQGKSDLRKFEENKGVTTLKDQNVFKKAIDNVDIKTQFTSQLLDSKKNITKKLTDKETKLQGKNKEIKNTLKASVEGILIKKRSLQPKKQVEFTRDDTLFIKVKPTDNTLKTENQKNELSPKETKTPKEIEHSKGLTKTDTESVHIKLKRSPLKHVTLEEFTKDDNSVNSNKKIQEIEAQHIVRSDVQSVPKKIQPDTKQRENLVSLTELDKTYLKNSDLEKTEKLANHSGKGNTLDTIGKKSEDIHDSVLKTQISANISNTTKPQEDSNKGNSFESFPSRTTKLSTGTTEEKIDSNLNVENSADKSSSVKSFSNKDSPEILKKSSKMQKEQDNDSKLTKRFTVINTTFIKNTSNKEPKVAETSKIVDDVSEKTQEDSKIKLTPTKSNIRTPDINKNNLIITKPTNIKSKMSSDTTNVKMSANKTKSDILAKKTFDKDTSDTTTPRSAEGNLKNVEKNTDRSSYLKNSNRDTIKISNALNKSNKVQTDSAVKINYSKSDVSTNKVFATDKTTPVITKPASAQPKVGSDSKKIEQTTDKAGFFQRSSSYIIKTSSHLDKSDNPKLRARGSQSDILKNKPEAKVVSDPKNLVKSIDKSSSLKSDITDFFKTPKIQEESENKLKPTKPYILTNKTFIKETSNITTDNYKARSTSIDSSQKDQKESKDTFKTRNIKMLKNETCTDDGSVKRKDLTVGSSPKYREESSEKNISLKSDTNDLSNTLSVLDKSAKTQEGSKQKLKSPEPDSSKKNISDKYTAKVTSISSDVKTHPESKNIQNDPVKTDSKKGSSTYILNIPSVLDKSNKIHKKPQESVESDILTNKTSDKTLHVSKPTSAKLKESHEVKKVPDNSLKVQDKSGKELDPAKKSENIKKSDMSKSGSTYILDTSSAFDKPDKAQEPKEILKPSKIDNLTDKICDNETTIVSKPKTTEQKIHSVSENLKNSSDKADSSKAVESDILAKKTSTTDNNISNNKQGQRTPTEEHIRYKCSHENIGFKSEEAFGKRRNLYELIKSSKTLNESENKQKIKKFDDGVVTEKVEDKNTEPSEKGQTLTEKSSSKSMKSNDKLTKTLTNAKNKSPTIVDKEKDTKMAKNEGGSETSDKFLSTDERSPKPEDVCDTIRHFIVSKIQEVTGDKISGKTEQQQNKNASEEKEGFNTKVSSDYQRSRSVPKGALRGDDEVKTRLDSADSTKSNLNLKTPVGAKTVLEKVKNAENELIKSGIKGENHTELGRPKSNLEKGLRELKNKPSITESEPEKTQKQRSKPRLRIMTTPYLTNLEKKARQKKIEEFEKKMNLCKKEENQKKNEEKSKKVMIAEMNKMANDITQQKARQQWEQRCKISKQQSTLPSTSDVQITDKTNVEDIISIPSRDTLMSKEEFLRLKELKELKSDSHKTKDEKRSASLKQVDHSHKNQKTELGKVNNSKSKPHLLMRKKTDIRDDILNCKIHKMATLLVDNIMHDKNKQKRYNLDLGNIEIKNLSEPKKVENNSIKEKDEVKNLQPSNITDVTKSINQIKATGKDILLQTDVKRKEKEKDEVKNLQPSHITDLTKSVNQIKATGKDILLQTDVKRKEKETLQRKEVFEKNLIQKEELNKNVQQSSAIIKFGEGFNKAQKLTEVSNENLRPSKVTNENLKIFDITSKSAQRTKHETKITTASLDRNDVMRKKATETTGFNMEYLQQKSKENLEIQVERFKFLQEGLNNNENICGLFFKCPKLQDFIGTGDTSSKSGTSKSGKNNPIIQMKPETSDTSISQEPSNTKKPFVKCERLKTDTEQMIDEKKGNQMRRRVKSSNIKNMIYKRSIGGNPVENLKKEKIPVEELEVDETDTEKEKKEKTQIVIDNIKNNTENVEREKMLDNTTGVTNLPSYISKASSKYSDSKISQTPIPDTKPQNSTFSNTPKTRMSTQCNPISKVTTKTSAQCSRYQIPENELISDMKTQNTKHVFEVTAMSSCSAETNIRNSGDHEKRSNKKRKGSHHDFRLRKHQRSSKTNAKVKEPIRKKEPTYKIKKSFCKRYILPMRNPKDVMSELMENYPSTLHKPVRDEIKVVPKEILELEEKARRARDPFAQDIIKSDPLAKYRHLKITFVAVKRPTNPKEKFLPTIVKNFKEKEISEQEKSSVINFRFQLLKRLNEEFKKLDDRPTMVKPPDESSFDKLPYKFDQLSGKSDKSVSKIVEPVKGDIPRKEVKEGSEKKNMHSVKVLLPIIKPKTTTNIDNLAGKIIDKSVKNQIKVENKNKGKPESTKNDGKPKTAGDDKHGVGGSRKYSTLTFIFYSPSGKGSDKNTDKEPKKTCPGKLIFAHQKNCVEKEEEKEEEKECEETQSFKDFQNDECVNDEKGDESKSKEKTFNITEAVPKAFADASERLEDNRRENLYYRYHQSSFYDLHGYLNEKRTFVVAKAEAEKKESKEPDKNACE